MSPLISAHQLNDLLLQQTHNIVLLDASYGVGAAGLSPETAYNQARIGHARFFDIDVIADQNSPLPHMLPSPADFAEAIGMMGIGNDSHVIVYDQTGIVFAASRAWWMFRAFGHAHVQILDGGLPEWVRAGLPLTTGPAAAGAAPAIYKPLYRENLVVSSHRQMSQIVGSSSATVLDARPPERFAGLSPEPRPGLEAGHMPGALNVPAGTLIDPSTGRLRDRSDLLGIFSSLNLTPDSPIVTTCGSGVTACVIALALNVSDYENVSVYDASWSEWGRKELNSQIVKSFQ